MSALTGCQNGLKITGLIGSKRNDSYTIIYETFKQICKQRNIQAGNYTRAELKGAIMPYFYGSKRTVERVFGSDEATLQAFFDAVSMEASGAFELRNYLVQLHDETKTEYGWYLPDHYYAYTPIIVDEEYDIPEANTTIKLKRKGTTERYIANSAK